jgi:hypothetical protein
MNKLGLAFAADAVQRPRRVTMGTCRVTREPRGHGEPRGQTMVCAVSRCRSSVGALPTR